MTTLTLSQVDISNIVDYALPILGAVGIWFIRAGSTALKNWADSHVSLLKDKDKREEFNSFMDHLTDISELAAGKMYSWAVANEVDLGHPVVKSIAVGKALSFVNSFVGERLHDNGFSQSDVEDLIEGQLGKLLASDPNVSAVNTGKVPNADTLAKLVNDSPNAVNSPVKGFGFHSMSVADKDPSGPVLGDTDEHGMFHPDSVHGPNSIMVPDAHVLTPLTVKAMIPAQNQ
jgi:hypothetical protein